MNRSISQTYGLRLPGKIYSGAHSIEKLREIIDGKYKKIAVFTDAGVMAAGVLNRTLAILKETGVQFLLLDNLPSEPTWQQGQDIVARCLNYGAELIVAVGGGSVMDVAKLASVLDDKDSVKTVLEHPEYCKKRIPAVMIPTTAGTGAEATPNCILAVPEKELKVGVVSEEMLADFVILERENIRRLPPAIAAATGVDALCHAVECYTSKKATPFSDMFAMEALRLIIPSIEKACMEPDALEEKEKMLLGSFYAGVAITASGTTGVHALSYPLGGKYHIPHGVANAIMLLPVMHYNESCCIEEFSRIYDACLTDGNEYGRSEAEKADSFLLWLDGLLKKLPIKLSLKEYGIKEEDLDTLVNAGMEVQRLLVNNKREITAEAARRLYREVID